MLRDALATRKRRADAESNTLQAQVTALKAELARAAAELRTAHREHAHAVKEQMVAEASARILTFTVHELKRIGGKHSQHAAKREVNTPASASETVDAVDRDHGNEDDADDTDLEEDSAHKRVTELESQVGLQRNGNRTHC